MPSKYLFVSLALSPEGLCIIFRERGHRTLYEFVWQQVNCHDTIAEVWDQAKTVVSRLTAMPADVRRLRKRYRQTAEPVGDFVIRGIYNHTDLTTSAAIANPEQAPTGESLHLRTLDDRGECFLVVPTAFCRDKGLREGQVVCLPECEPQGYC